MDVLGILILLCIPAALMLGLWFAMNRWGAKHDRMTRTGIDPRTPGYADRQRSSLRDD